MFVIDNKDVTIVKTSELTEKKETLHRFTHTPTGVSVLHIQCLCDEWRTELAAKVEAFLRGGPK